MPFKRSLMRYAHVNGHTTCRYTEDGDNIITCGMDGDIRLWKSVDDDDPTSQCIGEFALSVVQYANRLLVSSDCNCIQGYTYPAMEKDGIDLRFAAPATCIQVNDSIVVAGSEDTEIKVADLGKPDTFYSLKGHTGPILSIGLSPNGLLASCAGDGSLKIWNLQNKTVVRTFNDFKKVKEFEDVTCLVSPVFEPTKGELLAYAKDQEIILRNTDNWSVKITLSNAKVTADYSTCAFSNCGKYIAAGSLSGEISIWNVASEKVVGGDVAGESQRITSICWNPSGNGELAYCDNSGQLGTVVDIIESSGGSKYTEFGDDEALEDEIENYSGSERMDADDADDDNENCISLKKIINETIGIDENTKDSTGSVDKEPIAPTVSTIREYMQQSAFQPSATPRTLQHRFLIWNDVGIVRSHATDSEEAIEVEFHDASVHHGMHLNNYLHHTMAALSTSVLALAGNDSSKLVCIALNAGGIREWSIELPNCEEAVAVTATERLVAVATETRVLRIFSPLGTQRGVLSIPGNVVTLAGHKNRLAVVYHNSAASSDQRMSMMLIEVFGLQFKCRYMPITLSEGSKLTWFGFTDKGSPVSFDHLGMLRIFKTQSNAWFPICDTTAHIQNISNTYHILYVSEEMQTISCILCRGASFPLTSPRPAVAELKWQQPFCDIDDEASKLEETLQRYAQFSMDGPENSVLKQTTLKLFAMHCRSEREARAKELIEMVSSPACLALAAKYASSLGRQHLADKLSEMLPQIEQEEEERQAIFAEKETDVIESSQPNFELNAFKPKPVTPVIAPKKMLLGSKNRNPFKSRASLNSSTNSNGTPSNPLSHLTSKAIGFERPSTPIEDIERNENNQNQDNGNGASSETPEQKKPNFVEWYKEQKVALKEENPDMDENQLLKVAMAFFKSAYNPQRADKRKIDDETESGVVKVGRFQFSA